MRVMVAILLLAFGCGAERPKEAWSPTGLDVVWHDSSDSLAPRDTWGPSGLDLLADYLDEEGTTPFELVFELHSGSPTQTDADPATWGFPLHFGVGGPWVDDGEVHMFECSVDGGVYEVDDYLAFCKPADAILYIVYPADGRVAIDAPPDPPASIAGWWRTTIAYETGTHAERLANLTTIPKYAFYGISGQGYEVPIAFEPAAERPPAPWDDRKIERWRVAKFDDR